MANSYHNPFCPVRPCVEGSLTYSCERLGADRGGRALVRGSALFFCSRSGTT